MWLTLFYIFIAPPIVAYIIFKILDYHHLKNLSKYDDKQNFIIIGTGFSGILAGIKLLEQGIKNFKILERKSVPGGTWQVNTYPGAECDVMSHLYSYSFDLNPDWGCKYPRQSEILEYTLKVIKRFGLEKYIVLNREVCGATFDEKNKTWKVQVKNLEKGGQIYDETCNILMNAIGPMDNPNIPNFKNREIFKGKQMHSQQFDHTYNFEGKNVALVGSAASAIQIAPEIASIVKNLNIFSRTPNYVGLKFNFKHPQWFKFILRYVPGVMLIYRYLVFFRQERVYLLFKYPWGRRLLRKVFLNKMILPQIKDFPEDLQKKLIPQYETGCKRILAHDNYYPIFKRDNVHLVTEGIQEFTENGIIQKNGEKIEVDCVIYATGFSIGKIPFDIIGKNGKNLGKIWGQDPSAYKGTYFPDFPNCFILMGPGTGLGHNSYIHILESQMRFICNQIQYVVQNQIKQFEVKEQHYIQDLKEHNRKAKTSVWITGGCQSWYKTKDGSLFTLWVGFSTTFWWAMRKFNRSAFIYKK